MLVVLLSALTSYVSWYSNRAQNCNIL